MTERNHTPLITIVIPTYNRMPYIIEAIDSVIAQTYTNWELFVVDDGSTDNTVSAIKSKGYLNVSIIELAHKGLIGPLRNEGVYKGKGELICFLDSDDVWLPEKLEVQVNALSKSGMECCYTNFSLMDEKGNAIPVKAGKYEPFSGNIISKVLTTEAAVTIGTLMLSRNLFNRVGGISNNPALMYRDDYEFTLRLALHAEIVALPETSLRIREYSGRGTNSIDIAIAHVRSAIPYEIFIANKPGRALAKIAFHQYYRHVKLAAKMNIKMYKYIPALKQLIKISLLSVKVIFQRKK